jgi:hypothetical protein
LIGSASKLFASWWGTPATNGSVLVIVVLGGLYVTNRVLGPIEAKINRLIDAENKKQGRR